MSTLQAIVLGIVQGLTEFLPVSSSGHLVIVPALLHWEQPGLAFVVAVHLGTLVAVLVYYWRDWWRLISATGGWLVGGRRWPPPDDVGVVGLLLLGTVPAAAVGLLLADAIEKLFNDVALVAAGLIVTGLMLLLANARAHDHGASGRLSLTQALLVGFGQAVAIVPGISRSGTTISVGLLAGLQRDWAARFAFLLSVPVIAGAGAKEGLDLLEANITADQWLMLGYGLLAGAVSGLVAIHAVVRVVHTGRLWCFGIYCIAAGMLTLSALVLGLLR